MSTPDDKTPYATLRDRYDMEDLLRIMALLRAPGGCPWDRAQTHESLIPNMLEEAYEVIDAIQDGTDADMAEELGDVLMQVVFHACIAEEAGRFSFDDVVTGICRKLVSRHTHVFGDDVAHTADDVLDTWERNKNREKGLASASDRLRKATRSLPALMRSYKVQKKAADVGFDWDDPSGALEKIREELDEIRATDRVEEPAQRQRDLEEEFGDLLFSVVNYARHRGVEPETALDRSCDKFIRRFTGMEEAIRASGASLDDMTLEQMDRWWDRVKRQEVTGGSEA